MSPAATVSARRIPARKGGAGDGGKRPADAKHANGVYTVYIPPRGDRFGDAGLMFDSSQESYREKERSCLLEPDLSGSDGQGIIFWGSGRWLQHVSGSHTSLEHSLVLLWG